MANANQLNSRSAVLVVRRRGHTNGGASLADPLLAPYLRRLDAGALMSAERELAAATELRSLRCRYWRRLLGVRPLFPAIFERIRAALGDGLPRPDADGELDEAALSRLADALVDVDPSCDLADRIAADVHALAAGGECGELDVKRRPRRDILRRESARITSCRMAWSTARKEFIAANLRLVVSMARRFEASGRLPLADLIQEGNVGLMTATDRFDPRRGFRFSTYAAWWIRHAISRGLSDTGRTVRLPVHIIELQIKLSKLRRDFERLHMRAPRAEELAALAGVPVEKITGLDRALFEPTSTPRNDGEDGSIAGLEALPDSALPDSASLLHRNHVQRELLAALDELDPNQLRILRMRYGLDGEEAMTLREVGESYSLSRERIRQLQEGALRVLRHALERRGFEHRDVLDELPA